jgi:hypothetical protein
MGHQTGRARRLAGLRRLAGPRRGLTGPRRLTGLCSGYASMWHRACSEPPNVTFTDPGLVSSIETHPADQRFLRHLALVPLVPGLPLLSHGDYRAGRSLRAGPPAR